jgi:hypothetical protein
MAPFLHLCQLLQPEESTTLPFLGQIRGSIQQSTLLKISCKITAGRLGSQAGVSSHPLTYTAGVPSFFLSSSSILSSVLLTKLTNNTLALCAGSLICPAAPECRLGSE